jgi:hypothetical protein
MLGVMAERHVSASQRVLLGIAALSVVGGSHLGMIWLAGLYINSARDQELFISPEQLTGGLATACLVFSFLLGPQLYSLGRAVGISLLAFIGFAIFGELLRPDLRLISITTFFSFGVAYFVGVGLASWCRDNNGHLPLTGWLLGTYVLWYSGLAFYFVTGELGFFSTLEGAVNIQRLSFVSGYSATEIPMWVGLHVPVLLYIVSTTQSPMKRITSIVLLFMSAVIVLTTASVGAMISYFAIFFIYFGPKNLFSARSLMLLAPTGYTLTVLLNWLASGQFAMSVYDKLDRVTIGEGARGKAYDDMIYRIMQKPLGIGKGRFVEQNSFGWGGEGIYPHHNLLGIGVELGVICLALYIWFIVATINICRKRAMKPDLLGDANRQLISAVLAIFAYQQLRGMLHDTWILKEIYLWVGIAAGLLVKRSKIAGSFGARKATGKSVLSV